MTKRFDVHVYPVARIKITGIEAENPEEAIQKAEEAVDFHELLDIRPPKWCANVTVIEYAEEIAGFLVDEENDPEHGQSAMCDRFEGKLVPHRSIPELLRQLINACVVQRKCCEEALSDEWDRGDDGFKCMGDGLTEILEQARAAGFGDWIEKAEKDNGFSEREET